MSRINEALRRVEDRTGQGASSSPSQSVFTPAWAVEGGEHGGRDEPAPASAEPSMLSGASGAAMVRFSSQWSERLASAPQCDPTLVEQFRRLAATLHQTRRVNNLQSVMVTSALPGDGKTLTAINLAIVLSESYRYNVLLVDADLRRPSIPTVVDLEGGSGLSEALRAPTDQKLALVRLTPRLTLLPAGQPIANTIEALTSPRMRQILEEAETRFDWIVLDAPPVAPTADARLLTEMVDGTLFVIRAGRTQFDDVRNAVDAVGRDRILGVVLNGTDSEQIDGYYAAPRTQDKG